MALPTDDPIVQRWTAIGAGLLIGLGAKYAILIQDRSTITWRDLVVDVLLLAANALLASILIARLGITGPEAIGVAALFGASSDRVIRIIRRRFEERVNIAAEHIAASVTTVPTSGTQASVHFVENADPRAAPFEAMREILKGDPAKLAEFEAMLKALD